MQYWAGSSSTGVHRFFTSQTERMRITSTGNVGIGTTSPTQKLSVYNGNISIINTTDYLSTLFLGDSGAYIRKDQNSDFLEIFNVDSDINIQLDGGTNIFSAAGAVYQANNSSTWSTISDIRIKENIRNVNKSLDKILSLRPVHFEYKNKIGKIKTGFIAQEFEQVLPGHIIEQKVPNDLKNFIDSETIKSIDTDLIPYLVKAIQEIVTKYDAKIAELKAEIDELKNK
jgi:hypothetical protein